MRVTICLLILLASANVFAELKELYDENLETIAAQSRGLTIDIDGSDVGFVYSYKNNGNPNEGFWIAGNGTGSGSAAVNGLGSGAGLVEFNGITLDVGVLPDDNSIHAIEIGLPETIRLNRVNTGDYYIVHSDPGSPNTPPSAIDPNRDRKLIGLKWNTPPELDFAIAGQTAAAATNVANYNYSNHPIRMSGQVLVFPN